MRSFYSFGELIKGHTDDAAHVLEIL